MLEIEYKNTNDLIPYVNNTRTHSEEQVNQIASSIKLKKISRKEIAKMNNVSRQTIDKVINRVESVMPKGVSFV